jgi:hypothetical protein
MVDDPMTLAKLVAAAPRISLRRITSRSMKDDRGVGGDVAVCRKRLGVREYPSEPSKGPRIVRQSNRGSLHEPSLISSRRLSSKSVQFLKRKR